VSYDRDLGNGLEIGFNANVRWEDDRRTSTQALTTVAAGTGTLGPTLNLIRSPNDIQESNAKVNLRFAIGSVDDRWRVEVWGNNIFDEQTYHVVANTPLRGVSSLPGPLNAGGISLSRIAFLQEPRTYGVTLRTQF
jgi:iron complex outermembrane recepter protein